jgi:hypothetical protein
MKRLITSLFLFSWLGAISQCDTTLSISVNSNSVGGTATWAAVTGAVTYSWAVLPAGTTTVSIMSGVSSANVVSFSGLSANTAYRFQVVTICSGSTSLPKRSPFTTKASQVVYTPMTAAGYQYKYLKVDSLLHVSIGDTTIARGDTRAGAIVYKDSDSLFYGWNGLKWSSFGGNITSLTASIANKVDTIFFNIDTLFYKKNSITYGVVLNLTPQNRAIVAGYGLAGGGDLSADRSFIVDSTVIASKPFVNAASVFNINQPAFSFLHRASGVGVPSFRQQLFFNKDSVPIITGRQWGFVLDTTDNQLKRQQLLNYTSGVAGRVPFFTGANTLGSDSALFWDNTNKRLRINQSTDAGFRLDVNGTARVSSSTTPQFRIDNPSFTNGSVRFNVAGDYGFQILDNQGYGFISNTTGLFINSRAQNINIWTQSGNQTILQLGGQDINPTIARTRTAIQPVQSTNTLFSPTSGNHIDYLFRTENNTVFSPTSGNTTYTFLQVSPAVNATGTYSGIVRGLFYNPTLTSLTGTTHRAIETTTGDVLFNTTSGNTLIGTTTQLANARLTVNGKIAQPTTANSPKGTATLVNGVVTVNNTLATTGSFIQVNYRTGTALSSTSSILTVSSLVNATSFTVTALNAGAVTTNTSDNNQIEYTITN